MWTIVNIYTAAVGCRLLMALTSVHAQTSNQTTTTVDPDTDEDEDDFPLYILVAGFTLIVIIFILFLRLKINFKSNRRDWLRSTYHENTIYSVPMPHTSTDRFNESVRRYLDARQPQTADSPVPYGEPGGLTGAVQSGLPPSYEEIISQSKGKPCVMCNHPDVPTQSPYVASPECPDVTPAKCPYCQYDDAVQPPSYDDVIAQSDLGGRG